jgi:pimeloyl-ACP methyl ester carboxylesterase
MFRVFPSLSAYEGNTKMRLIRENVEGSHSAAASVHDPAPLLQWQRSLYPPGPSSMRTGFRTVDGVRIRYAESSRTGERTLMLTSPWPESLYAFSPIWNALRRRFRLLAIDLPGFGASECRDDLLEPHAMGEFVLKVIDDFGLDRVHLVGPDVGGSAVLFAAASAPQMVASAIIGSGVTAWPLDLGDRISGWAAPSDVDLVDEAGYRQFVGAVLDGVQVPLPNGIRDDYLSSYTGERFVQSMRYVRRCPEDLPALARVLPEIVTPVLIIAGEHDAVVPSLSGEFLADRLPNSQLVCVDAGHFVWEDAPESYMSLVAGWATNGYRALGTQR